MEVKKSRKAVAAVLIVSAFLAVAAGLIAWYYYSISDFQPTESDADLTETICSSFDLYDSTDLVNPIRPFRGDEALDPSLSYQLVARVDEPDDINSNNNSGDKIRYFTLVTNDEKQQFDIDSNNVDQITPGEYVITLRNLVLPSDKDTVNFSLIGHNQSNQTENAAVNCDTLTFTIDSGRQPSGSDGQTDGNNEEPNTEDFYACNVDSDCVKVSPTCCGCEAGGSEIAVNSNYQSAQSRGLTCDGSIVCAQVYQCTNSVPFCNAGRCSLRAETPETPDTDEPSDTPSTEDPEGTPDETPAPTGIPSALTVSKDGTKCVERVSPSNVASFKVTVSNTSSTSNSITKIVDKLPLGFTYVTGSTLLNGAALADSSLSINEVGQTQELTWTNATGWPISASGTVTLEFKATATANALTGTNMNEVVITPSQTPSDLSTLRSSFTFNVEQNCTSPSTGLFDSAVSKVALGGFIIIAAFLFYRSQRALMLSERIITSETLDNINSGVKLGVLKATSPREYFEKKLSRDLDKKKKSK